MKFTQIKTCFLHRVGVCFQHLLEMLCVILSGNNQLEHFDKLFVFEHRASKSDVIKISIEIFIDVFPKCLNELKNTDDLFYVTQLFMWIEDGRLERLLKTYVQFSHSLFTEQITDQKIFLLVKFSYNLIKTVQFSPAKGEEFECEV